jgi:beta,beta-carotene 9',10'-dioxygenase
MRPGGDEKGGTTRREAIARGAGAAAALTVAGSAATAQAKSKRAAYALGFTSFTDEVRIPHVPVEGKLPSWLGGTLLRNGPAKFEVGSQPFNHWFDGLAMLHAFRFAGGKVGYANRFLRSSAYEAWKQDGKIKYSEFATDPCRSVFSGVASIPIIAPISNANVSLEKLADHFVAHTEVPIPVRFDPKTLKTIGVEESLRGTGTLGTAHPHVDSTTGERFSYEVDLIPPTGYRVIVRGGKGGAKPRTLAKIPRPEPAYMHSFALTDRYVIVLEQPFVVDPGVFLKPDRKPIIANYRWEPKESMRLIVIDRHAGGVKATVEVDPFFVFHNVNAFDRNGRIEMDVCAYRDNTIIDALYLKNLRRADRRLPNVRFRRLTVDPAAAKATIRTLADVELELPRIDYATKSRRRYRYVYGIGRTPTAGFVDELHKVDVLKGKVKTWHEKGAYPGEAIFVRRPHGSGKEDDGVILSVVLDGPRKQSFLLVLDAKTFEERARAAVPHHIPFGFHGLHAAA